jgi:hypothetical protein
LKQITHQFFHSISCRVCLCSVINVVIIRGDGAILIKRIIQGVRRLLWGRLLLVFGHFLLVNLVLKSHIIFLVFTHLVLKFFHFLLGLRIFLFSLTLFS